MRREGGEKSDNSKERIRFQGEKELKRYEGHCKYISSVNVLPF